MSIRSLLTRGRADGAGVRAEATPADVPGDRRRLLKMLGATAVGAVGASLLEASPAGAADGDDVVLGGSNVSSSVTLITCSDDTALSSTTSLAGQAGLLGTDDSSGGYGVSGYSTNGLGVYGLQTGASGLVSSPAGVVGDSTVTHGVIGVSSSNNGVRGITSADSWGGVIGLDQSMGGGFGVQAYSNENIGLQAQGGQAPIQLVPSGTAGAPTTGTAVLGEMFVDINGVFYKCVAAGTPGTWVPMYSVVPLLAPVRVISTPSGGSNTGGLTGPFAPNGDTHTTTVLTGGATGIPDIAVAVLGNLTISANGGTLNGDGYLTLFPGGASNPGTSSLNSGETPSPPPTG